MIVMVASPTGATSIFPPQERETHNGYDVRKFLRSNLFKN